MRNQEVCEAFARGEEAKASTVRTDGVRLFSYGTVIAQRHNGRILVNVTKYSVTTSKHQTYVRYAIKGLPQEEISGVERGSLYLV